MHRNVLSCICVCTEECVISSATLCASHLQCGKYPLLVKGLYNCLQHVMAQAEQCAYVIMPLSQHRLRQADLLDLLHSNRLAHVSSQQRHDTWTDVVLPRYSCRCRLQMRLFCFWTLCHWSLNLCTARPQAHFFLGAHNHIIRPRHGNENIRSSACTWFCKHQLLGVLMPWWLYLCTATRSNLTDVTVQELKIQKGLIRLLRLFKVYNYVVLWYAYTVWYKLPNTLQETVTRVVAGPEAE